MRLLHLLASPVWSGPADLIAALASAQRALGHEVSVAVDRKRGSPPAEEPIVPRLRDLGLLDEHTPSLELSVKSSVPAVLRDLSRLRLREVDVIHAHFSHDHLLARFGRRSGTLLVRSVHAPRSLRRSLPHAEGYTVPARPLLERLGSRAACVLPAPVPAQFRPAVDRTTLRRELGLEGAPLIGMVSTFQPSRRHALGIDAFAVLLQQRPDARLLLVGDGMLEADLRAQVERLKLTDRVIFAGYHSGDSFVRRLQSLDEVWILGLGNDWSGRAAAQARACGVRVVAVEEGALAEYADVLVPALEPDAVVQASLSQTRANKRVFSPEDVAREMDAFYAACRAGAERR